MVKKKSKVLLNLTEKNCLCQRKHLWKHPRPRKIQRNDIGKAKSKETLAKKNFQKLSFVKFMEMSVIAIPLNNTAHKICSRDLGTNAKSNV